MKIFLGSDHRGFHLKNLIKEILHDLEINEIQDLGTFDPNQPVDYPDIAKLVSHAILENQNSIGILICHTGIGMSIAANKIKDIRAALVTTPEMAQLAKKHNNANIICLPGGFLNDKYLIREILESFLKSEFEGGRHALRLKKIKEIENEK